MYVDFWYSTVCMSFNMNIAWLGHESLWCISHFCYTNDFEHKYGHCVNTSWDSFVPLSWFYPLHKICYSYTCVVFSLHLKWQISKKLCMFLEVEELLGWKKGLSKLPSFQKKNFIFSRVFKSSNQKKCDSSFIQFHLICRQTFRELNLYLSGCWQQWKLWKKVHFIVK